MPEKFFDFVRGATDVIPEGYAEPGLRAYRHLVFLGVSQILEAHFPALRQQLADAEWQFLLAAFIRGSAWTSNYYGDLVPAFVAYLAHESGHASGQPSVDAQTHCAETILPVTSLGQRHPTQSRSDCRMA